jgi:hypothetical protein
MLPKVNCASLLFLLLPPLPPCHKQMHTLYATKLNKMRRPRAGSVEELVQSEFPGPVWHTVLPLIPLYVISFSNKVREAY